MTELMRAWQVPVNGPAWDVLSLRDDVPVPSPGAGQVAVRVDAAGLNFPDLLLCLGQYQERPPLPFTPGVEVAGTVTATGEGASLAVGTRVVGGPDLPHGGFAEHCLMRADQVLLLPDDVTAVTAAASYITYQTAYVGLHRRALLRAGETLLVNAGASGTGSAAVQLGVASGARVIATASTPEKVELCRRLGAEVAVLSTGDVLQAVKAATGGRGADVVWDPVGGEAFELSRRAVAFEGRLVVVGFASGHLPDAPASHLLVKNYSVVGLHWGLYRSLAPGVVRDAHRDLMRMLASGLISPVVDEVLSLEQVPEGLHRLARRQVLGTLVVGSPYLRPRASGE